MNIFIDADGFVLRLNLTLTFCVSSCAVKFTGCISHSERISLLYTAAMALHSVIFLPDLDIVAVIELSSLKIISVTSIMSGFPTVSLKSL